MRKETIACAAALALTATYAHAEGEPEQLRPVVHLAAGPSVTYVSGLTPETHVNIDALVGIKLNESRDWAIALAMGASANLNGADVWGRHEVGFLLRGAHAYVAATGGSSFVHPFTGTGADWTGAHLTLRTGLRLGHLLLGLAYVLDTGGNVEATTLAFSLGATL